MSRQRWRRKWEADALEDGWSPIPTQVVSNEEYPPFPPTPMQQAVAHRLRAMSHRHAKKLGMPRRQFLASACGMAAAFLAMNAVFGRFFEVDPVEAWEVAASAEAKRLGQFVFDAQTHHVAAPRWVPFALQLRRMGRRLNPDLANDRGTMDEVYLENYIKEVFLDSDTSVAIISGLPSATESANILPPDKMAETREVVNRLAASRRVVTHGLVSPNKGPGDLDEMDRQVSDLKVEAWKGYPGQLIAGQPWTPDDEKVAYPMLERARRLGVRNVCLHLGLPFAGTPEDPWHPRHIEKAARDFPDVTFIVYHSGLKSIEEAARVDLTRRPARIDWVTDLCEIRHRNPGLTNIYAELGTTFGATAVNGRPSRATQGHPYRASVTA
jgi:predicted TIM-barrel fold metal-dependent hydrolase